MPVKLDPTKHRKEKKPTRHRDTFVFGGYKYHRNKPLAEVTEDSPSTKAQNQ